MTEDRIIKAAEVERITGRCRVSIWRDEKAGTFPRRLKTGQKSVGWRLSEVMQWLNTRQTA